MIAHTQDLPLFASARARHTDPETSVEAAQRVRPTDLQGVVLFHLEQADRGLTTHEIAERSGVPLVSVSPRMKPLEKAGLVMRIGRRDGRTVWRRV